MRDESGVEVRPSKKEGLGLFARRDFEEGDFIHEVHYEREITRDAPLRPECGERHDHCSYPDKRIMLVAYPGRHMNHSCDPNAYYEYAGDIAIARARRRIVVDEEIVVDYLINNSGGDSWPCACGSARCRGFTGTSFFDLPSALQKEYFPLLAPWFLKRYAARIQQTEDANQPPTEMSS